MTDYISSNSMLMLERAMNFQWTKQETLLDNIVNADTPGYKAKSVSFDNILEQARQGNAGRYDFKALVEEDLYTESRPDGNNVDIDQENIELVGSYFQTMALYQKIGGRISDLRYVIGQAFK